MGQILWPLRWQRQASAFVWIGRLLHWLLTAVAAIVASFGVLVSKRLLDGDATSGGILQNHALTFALECFAFAAAIYLVGRVARFMFSRE